MRLGYANWKEQNYMSGKKVLLITGIPVRTDTNTGKTLQTLFADFGSDELAQIYFSPQSPNTNMCSAYYRLCEKQMIKSLFGLRKGCGEEVSPVCEGENAVKPEKNALLLTRHRGNILMKLSREIVWSLSAWKNKNLKNWLRKVKPDVIFTILHDTNSAAKAVKWISDFTGVPVVLFVTDDYYNDQEKSKNLLRKIYYRKRQRLNKKLAENVVSLVGCSEKATEYFMSELNIKSGQTIYTPSAETYLAMPYKEQTDGGIVKIRYFGNLGLGRWEMLKLLGQTISTINADKKRALLEIYSSVTDPEIIGQLNIENACEYKGWVYGDEYLKLLQDADIAVHVESFEASMIRRTWVSVSTKIADYLGAGKCILAIGSSELASIDHIKDAACVVSDTALLKDTLEKLVSDAKMRSDFQIKAKKLAAEQHNMAQISAQVRTLIEENT